MWDNRFSNKGFEDLELIKAKDLGKGGYANVRMGRLKGDPTLYAVKIVDLSLLSAKEQDHMRQEIKAHAIMKHPNIIRFHYLLEDQEKLYMLLEYASNGDLYKVIAKRGKVSEKTACKIVAQVALALEYIHSKGILHRDLKPENILLDNNLVVKVSDFGWCGEYKRNLRSPGPGINGAPPQRMTFCGTYEYMAPEIIKGGHQDEKVDIWSLGILLYELVHGRTPFRSNSPLEIQENIIKGKFLVDTNVSPLAVDLIRRLLREDPRDRLDIKQVLGHTFIRVVLD